jgi:hypothetical protein
MKLNTLGNFKNMKLNVNKYLESLGDDIKIIWTLRQQMIGLQFAL